MARIRPATQDDIGALVALEDGFPEEDRFSRRTWQRLLRGNTAIILSQSGDATLGAAITKATDLYLDAPRSTGIECPCNKALRAPQLSRNGARRTVLPRWRSGTENGETAVWHPK